MAIAQPRTGKTDPMNLVLLGYHYGGGMVGGLTHMIVGSVINGLIFSVIFRLISQLTLPQALILVAVGLANMWARSRDRARW